VINRRPHPLRMSMIFGKRKVNEARPSSPYTGQSQRQANEKTGSNRTEDREEKPERLGVYQERPRTDATELVFPTPPLTQSKRGATDGRKHLASSAAYGSVFRHTLIIRVFAFGQFSVCNLPSSSLIFLRIGEKGTPSPFEEGQFSIRSQFSTALRKPHLFSTPSGKGIERSGTSGRLLPFKETLLGF